VGSGITFLVNKIIGENYVFIKQIASSTVISMDFFGLSTSSTLPLCNIKQIKAHN
jgi:hypothetical protein